MLAILQRLEAAILLAIVSCGPVQKPLLPRLAVVIDPQVSSEGALEAHERLPDSMVGPLAQVSRGTDGHIRITVTRPDGDGLCEQVRIDLAQADGRVEAGGQVIWYEESERVSGVIRDEAEELGGTVTLSANPFEASVRELRIHYDLVGKRRGRPLHVASTVLILPPDMRR